MQTRTGGRELRDEWLAGADEAFSGWGGVEMFDWVFGRDAGGPLADLILVDDPDGPLAGSGVSYRHVRPRGGAPLLVAIMTGSWTRPAARGRGCFTRIIEESVRLATHRGAGLLLAFVTEENASARRLAAAGAGRFPTWYCFSEPTTPRPSGVHPPVRPVDGRPLAEAFHGRSSAAIPATSTFWYPTLAAWSGQFLDRPTPVEVVEVDNQWAVRERVGNSDRINLLLDAGEGLDRRAVITSLLVDSRDNERQLFVFTSDEMLAATCRSVGMKTKPGFVTALVADGNQLAQALQIGELSMGPTDSALVASDGPWSLGQWQIHGGDRV